MKMFMVLLIGVFPAVFSVAQENATRPESSWFGYLVDVRYAAEIAQSPAAVMHKAAEYTRTRGLETGPSAGFGIMARGQWLEFDEKGNAQALEILRGATRARGFFVKVTGSLESGRIAVTSMEEINTTSPPSEY